MLTRQVVDYRAHDPVQDYLAERFGERNFDAILDCVGTQALYAHSPRYLKTGGKFVNIVGGWSQGVVPFVRNKLRPCLLGGTPRSYELFLLSASGKTARDVAAWVEQGVIKEAVVDSEFPFEQAAEVRINLDEVRHELTSARHSKGWQPAGPGARLLLKSMVVDPSASKTSFPCQCHLRSIIIFHGKTNRGWARLSTHPTGCTISVNVLVPLLSTLGLVSSSHSRLVRYISRKTDIGQYLTLHISVALKPTSNDLWNRTRGYTWPGTPGMALGCSANLLPSQRYLFRSRHG
jgi:hypothetical protein